MSILVLLSSIDPLFQLNKPRILDVISQGEIVLFSTIKNIFAIFHTYISKDRLVKWYVMDGNSNPRNNDVYKTDIFTGIMRRSKLPHMTDPSLAKELQMTAPTARTALNHLESIGILGVTGKKHEKVYVYSNYLNILEDGAEPFSREQSS